MVGPRVPEIPGGQVRTYKSEEFRFGLTAEIRQGAERVCQLHVLASRNEPEERVASVVCEYWRVDDPTRTAVERCVLSALSSKNLTGMRGKKIRVERLPTKSSFLGLRYDEEWNTREITRIANIVFDLVREELQNNFLPQIALGQDAAVSSQP